MRSEFSGEKGALQFEVGGREFVHLTGKGADARIKAECRTGRWVVTSVKSAAKGPCVLIDATSLRKTGALAVYNGEKGLHIVSAKEEAGQRLWNAD